LDPLPLVITPKDNISFVPPTTYKTLVPSSATPVHIHAHIPSTSCYYQVGTHTETA
jgi:hypothetical protein